MYRAVVADITATTALFVKIRMISTENLFLLRAPKREFDQKRGTFPQFAVYSDAAIVMRNYTGGNGETEAAGFVLFVPLTR